MTSVELVEPDLELAVMELLRVRFPILATPAGGPVRVASETPTDVSTRVTSSVPFVRVTDIGGSGRLKTEVGANVDVDVYGRSRNQARSLAAGIQAFLEYSPRSITVAGVYIRVDQAVTRMRPQRVPFTDTTISRYYASYQLSARR